MEVQKIRRVVAGFEDRQILLPEMGVVCFPTREREQKRVIGVVGVEQVQGSQVPGVVAGNRGEEGVQQVVALVVQLGVMDAEYFVELGGGALHSGGVQVVDDDRKRKLPEVVAVKFDLLNAFAQFTDAGLFPIVEQYILLGDIVQVDLAEERAFGVVKMATLGLDGAPCFSGLFLFPLRHHIEVGLHLEELLENKGEALRRGFFQCENLHEIIVYAEMRAVTFHVGCADKIIKKRIVLEPRALNFLGSKVEKSRKDTKRILFVQNPDGKK